MVLYLCWPIYFTNQYALTNRFSLYIWIFFNQPFYSYKWPSYPLKISQIIPILRKVFTQYYYLIYILLPSFSTISHLLQNWEKNHLQNPFNKQLVFFIFHILEQVFCFSWTKQLKKNQNWETRKIRNFFFLSRSPLFSTSKRENINKKNKKTNNTW